MDPAVWPKIPGGHTAELVPEGRGAQGEINNKGPQGGGGSTTGSQRYLLYLHAIILMCLHVDLNASIC